MDSDVRKSLRKDDVTGGHEPAGALKAWVTPKVITSTVPEDTGNGTVAVSDGGAVTAALS